MESRSPEDLDGAFVRGEFAPRQHEAGLIQGISIARVKFPTRTKNLHKVPAEWAQDMPLGDHLSELSACPGFIAVACVVLPCHCSVGGNATVFNSSLSNKLKMPIGVGKSQRFGAALARWVGPIAGCNEIPLYRPEK